MVNFLQSPFVPHWRQLAPLRYFWKPYDPPKINTLLTFFPFFSYLVTYFPFFAFCFHFTLFSVYINTTDKHVPIEKCVKFKGKGPEELLAS